jgi:micrococcal nuclease
MQEASNPSISLEMSRGAMRVLKVIASVGSLLISSCTTPAQHSDAADTALRGRAVKIVDGDTFDLLPAGAPRPVRIRLHGIDCPERGMDYGKAAKEAFGEIMRDQSLRVVAVDSDRYGRVVGHVYTDAGTWVNLEMVRRGMAWHYSAYSADQRLADAERKARASRVGLWSQSQPVAPWDWRKEKRKGGKDSGGLN